jgi:indolepyruvate ferredoxin oxidoreductase beta subunit
MSDHAIVNVVLAGVGGQGSVLATRILAGAARRAGFDVVTSEVHGMAQRGGTVTTTVRLGGSAGPALAPGIGSGEADVLVAFERLEAARHLPLLHSEGLALVNDQRITPSIESLKVADYPDDLEPMTRPRHISLHLVPAFRLATELGEPRLASTALLGALANHLELPAEAWRGAIAEEAPPKFVEANLAAFEAGREWGVGSPELSF